MSGPRFTPHAVAEIRAQFAARPDTRDLIAHSHRQVQDGQRTDHIAVFLYPDCIREFDGQAWSVKPLPAREVAA